MARAVFLDKDGTLVADTPGQLPRELLPGVGDGLRRLARSGFALVVVTNQAGLALGRFDEAHVEAGASALRSLLARERVALDGFYYCPHRADGTVLRYVRACACRKPEPGLLLQACRERGYTPSESVMVGDILDDVEAAHRAGCRAALLDNGGETEWRAGAGRTPDFVARDVREAAELILEAAAASRRGARARP